jgi:hypothetical protein
MLLDLLNSIHMQHLSMIASLLCPEIFQFDLSETINILFLSCLHFGAKVCCGFLWMSLFLRVPRRCL